MNIKGLKTTFRAGILGLTSQPIHLRKKTKIPKGHFFLWAPKSIFSAIGFVEPTDIINSWLFVE